MHNKTLSMALLLTSILLAGCQREVKPTSVESIRVKTAVAQASAMADERLYSGTVEESSGTSLSFPVAGTVKSVNVNEGDYVSAGALIGILDDSSLRNAHQISQSALNQAQDAYNRMKKLHDSGSLPDMQWVQVENTLQEARSAEAISRKALEDTRLYAPVGGYVTEKNIQIGMNVMPGMPMVNVVKIDPVKVNISIPENDISRIQEGAVAKLKVSALDGTEFIGKITEKSVSANPLTRSYDVKISLPNPERKLLPGMICEVVLSGEGEREGIVLPYSAVLLDSDNKNFVWTIKDNTARKRIVDVESLTDRGILLSSGIERGDSVIIEGQQKVSEGSKVEPIK